ncbi:MAG: hypothetical protein NT027_20695 [Proteobacteria bacterium]|nr:hypothetical protein [Pseudomonadota bacterium]
MVKRPKFLSGQNGSAITSALMGVAITSIVILAVSEMLNLSFKGQKKSELKLDKIAIARQLMEVIDCPKSFAFSKTCTPGAPTELRDSKNKIVVS